MAGSTLCAKWGVCTWMDSEDAREFCNLVDFSSRRRILYTIEVKKKTNTLSHLEHLENPPPGGLML